MSHPTSDDLELFHFPMSHFNEKARWTLDWKRLPHRRTPLLPGPHMVTARRLSGQAQVPILRDGKQIIAGSSQIVSHLEERVPEPRLFPEDPDQRRQALALQAELDAGLGPELRRAMFFETLQDPDYFCRQFTLGRSALQARAYRASFPMIAPIMKSQMNITAETAKTSLDATAAAFDRIGAAVGPDGYLVGSHFSVADLTAAALLSPAVHPPGGPSYPKPYPQIMQGWLGRWADHPTSAWVRTIYERHRGVSSEVPAA